MKKEFTRRDFLKITGALSSALLIKPDTASAYKEFSGWPDAYGCLTDFSECVGCRSCEKACNEANSLPQPAIPFDEGSVFNEKRRPDARAFTVVNRFTDPRDPSKFIYRKVQCNHCNEPACASACPIHAYEKTPEGAVLYDPAKCFGCRYCMIACPFYVPAYDYESALEPKIVKCIMCYPRIKAGRLPACVEACPAGAITFGKRKDLINLAREKIMRNPQRYVNHIYGEYEAGGTSWMYISPVPFEYLGFPTNIPKHPLIEEVKGFLGAVPVVFTVWPALFGMVYAAVKHRDELFKSEHKEVKK